MIEIVYFSESSHCHFSLNDITINVFFFVHIHLIYLLTYYGVRPGINSTRLSSVPKYSLLSMLHTNVKEKVNKK